MSIIKRLAVALLVCALTVCAFASCNPKATKTIFVYDGENMPSGVYIAYILTAINELEEKIDDAGYEGDKWSYTDDEVKNAKTWVKERALQHTYELAAVEKEFEKRGLSLTADEESNIEYIVYYYWDYAGLSSTYEGLGISKSSFERWQKASSLSQKILLSRYNEEESEDYVSDDDIKAYMYENYTRVNSIFFSKADPDDSTKKLEGDALEEVKNKAETVFAAAKESDDAGFIALLKENSDSYTDSTTDESLDLGNIRTKEDSGYAEELEKAIAGMKAGETVLCEVDDGWYVVRAKDMFEDGVVKVEDYRETVIIAKYSDEYTAEREAWAADLKANSTLVKASYDRYDPTDKRFNLN